jgi:hypothetical protein
VDDLARRSRRAGRAGGAAAGTRAPATGDRRRRRGYWTRNNEPQIDIVGADRGPVANTITVVGSVKWHENRPFDVHDLGRLAHLRDLLPGAGPETPLLVVSRTGSTVEGPTVLTADDVVAAY